MPWLVWRLVVQKAATLQEVETHYSIADVMRAHIALDTQALAELKGGRKT